MRVRTTLVAVLTTVTLSVTTFTAQSQDAGKEAFLTNNCNRCHAIESQQIEATVQSRRVRGPDLSQLEERRDAPWLKQYLEKELQANDRDHSVAWTGSDEDLKDIASWLASLE